MGLVLFGLATTAFREVCQLTTGVSKFGWTELEAVVFASSGVVVGIAAFLGEDRLVSCVIFGLGL